MSHSTERLTNLLNDDSLSRGKQSSIPKIQKVQAYLRGRKEFEKYYFPKLLSIGPIHHGGENLQLGEHYKQKWTKAYLEDAELDAEAAQQLRGIIEGEIQNLKKLYTEDAIEKYKDKNDDLVWMLFVDGCSVLHIISNAGDDWGAEAAKKLEIKVDQLLIVLQDMLFLENQLPCQLLRILTDNRFELLQSMFKFIENHNMLKKSKSNSENQPPPEATNTTCIDIEPLPAHLLDLLQKTLINQPSSSGERSFFDSLLKTSPNCQPTHRHNYKIRNIQELKAAGIGLRKSKEKSLKNVEFSSYRLLGRLAHWLTGSLELPEIIVDDFTAPTLMNLIAYEMCPEFPNDFEISSYVAFLDLLIDHPDDVKELGRAAVLENHMGNDEEVAKLFNSISTDLIVDVTKYACVRNQIEEHCSNRWHTWIAEVYSAHFSSPWTFIAFLTAVIITGLTVIQTWFTIRPPKSILYMVYIFIQ